MKKHLKRIAAVFLATSLIIPTCYSSTPLRDDSAVKAAVVANQDDDSDGKTKIEKLNAQSVNGKIEVQIWKDSKGTFYYSAYRNGYVTLKCAPLGLVAEEVDLSTGLQLDESSISKKKGKEEYDWIQGSKSHVSKEYQELSFLVKKGKSNMKIVFRLFEDGIGYRYEVDADTTKTDEVITIKEEKSAFEFPMDATIWAPDGYSSTYEPGGYSSRKMSAVKSGSGQYAPAILARAANGDSNVWMLLSEAGVYSEEDPYCATIFKTEKNNAELHVNFSRRLKQEDDPAFDGKTFQAIYEDITSISRENEFHTPWRAAIMTDTLNDLTNSSLLPDLNPPAEGDFSWVEPGTSSWSWWSTGDPVEYKSMYAYIDYAKEIGQKYCLVDFGWENWDNYEPKIKNLCEYANERNVGIIVWYGVKKRDHDHRVDLDRPERIEKEFAWCEKMGVSGVKVDYIESDSPFAMKVMHDVAAIAAKHKLVVNYHGCTDPNGENRTFPNILSSEAVCGSEFFKWGEGSNLETLLTLPYTRNVQGSMEFTPVCTKVKNRPTTDGFMLAMPIVYESAIQTLAHSCFVYPGYGGSSLLTDIPSSWDESVLLEGSEPRKAAIRARRKGDLWYLGVMTVKAATYDISLNFLDKNTTYTAYVYTDKEDSSGIDMTKKTVTSTDTLTFDLKKASGLAIRFSKEDNMRETVYDKYNYFEAEDAYLGISTKTAEDIYASRFKYVNKLTGAKSRVAFEKIEAPESGYYDVKLYVISPDKKSLTIRSNHYESVTAENLVGIEWNGRAVGCGVASDKVYKENSTKVYLDKGSNNTIYVYNANEDENTTVSGLDRIAVSKNPVEAGEAPATTDTEPDLYADYPRPTPKPTPTPTAVPTPVVTPTSVPTTAPTVTPAPTDNPGATASPTTGVTKPAQVKGLAVKSKKKKQIEVTFTKVKGADGYQVAYGTKKNMTGSKKIAVKLTSAKIKKLKSKKIYYIRVRAYKKKGKGKVYGIWSDRKKVKVK